MADIARNVGMNGFQKTLKEFIKSQENPKDRIYIDGTTMFTGQPLELSTGKWRADDFGVSRMTMKWLAPTQSCLWSGWLTLILAWKS